MKNCNLQAYIESNRECQALRIADFFVDADNIDPANGFGIAQMLRWKAEPAMIAEEAIRELASMENFLERVSADEQKWLKKSESPAPHVCGQMIDEWTQEIMRGVGGQSTCPITNVAGACRQTALRNLVDFFTPVLRQLNKDAA